MAKPLSLDLEFRPRCFGITKKKVRCKNRASDSDGYCRYHRLPYNPLVNKEKLKKTFEEVAKIAGLTAAIIQIIEALQTLGFIGVMTDPILDSIGQKLKQEWKTGQSGDEFTTFFRKAVRFSRWVHYAYLAVPKSRRKNIRKLIKNSEEGVLLYEYGLLPIWAEKPLNNCSQLKISENGKAIEWANDNFVFTSLDQKTLNGLKHFYEFDEKTLDELRIKFKLNK